MATSAEESVDYDPISGRPKARHHVPTSPTGPKPHGNRPNPGGSHRGDDNCDDNASTAAGSATGRSGGGMTATMESVNYNAFSDGSGHNVDGDAGTMMGVEIKERFKTMRAAFLKMDLNHDGRITKNELLEMCRNWNIPASEAERVIQAADMDHNHSLDFNEFAQRFDPYEGTDGDDGTFAPMGQTTAQGMSLGSTADNRPIKSNGWGGDGGDEATRRPEELQAAVGGSGSRAARSLHGDPGGSGADENAQLRARIAQLEAELANERALKGNACGCGGAGGCACGCAGGAGDGQKIAELQNELAKERAQKEDLIKRLNAAGNQGGGSRGAGSGAGAGAHSGAGAGAQGRQQTPTPAASQQQAAPEMDDRDMSTVFVYGKSGDKKSDDVCKQLRSAQIPFVKRDSDKDKKYVEPLTESGGPSSAQPPIVCLGMRAWWDDPDAPKDDMFSIPFGASVAMELRHDLGDSISRGPQIDAPVRQDADIETEIAERFSSMQKAFLKLDANQDGRIGKKELISKCKDWNIPVSEAERAIAAADIDGDGMLDFNEFAQYFNGALTGGHNMTHSMKGGSNFASRR